MRRAPALRPLSDDHHGALVLARRCRRAARSPRSDEAARVREAVIGAWTAELAPHFAIEEEALLPALRELGETGFAEGIRGDHGALRALHARIRAGHPEPNAALGEALEAFGRLLERHVRYEEREVFAGVQDRLTPEQCEALGRATAAHPRTTAPPEGLG